MQCPVMERKVFNTYHGVVFADGGTGLMQVVSPDVGNAAVDFLDFRLGFLPVAAEFLLPVHRLLCFAQGFLMTPEAVQWRIVGTIIQCRKAGDAHVDADSTALR